MVVASAEPGYAFVFPADMTMYPAKAYCEHTGFNHHYYPKVGDLKWRLPGGALTQEAICAQAIDLLDEVEFWVRNLVHQSQFWMPTSRMRTYPDFVAKLHDGRLLVVEHKGGDRFSNDDSSEKRMIGNLWAKRSGGKGVYVMTQLNDEQGRSIRDQLLHAIHGGARRP